MRKTLSIQASLPALKFIKLPATWTVDMYVCVSARARVHACAENNLIIIMCKVHSGNL